MKRRLRIAGPVGLLVSALLFALVFCLFARGAVAETPVPVELIGTFLPGEETGPGIYRLEYEGLKRTFQVQDVHLLAAAYAGSESGWDVLNEVGGWRILLTGKDELIRPMMQGKPPTGRYALQGTLYVSDARLALESVRKIEKES